jgi:metaxin
VGGSQFAGYTTADASRLGSSSLSVSFFLQVIADVEMVYSILNNRLEGRDYFVAGRPTTIDALLYAHLNYHRYAPVGEIDLRPVIGKYKAIATYLEFIRSNHFKGQPKPPPVFQPTEEEKREAAAVREVKTQSWSEWFYGSSTVKTKRTEKEARFKRRSQIFMGFMASAVAVYVLLSDVAGLEFYDSDDEEEDDENDRE